MGWTTVRGWTTAKIGTGVDDMKGWKTYRGGRQGRELQTGVDDRQKRTTTKCNR